MPDATGESSVAERLAAATAARVCRPDYGREVRALLDAARRVVASTGKARVADIVAEAGLTNDAFYRHFPSKDAMVAALVEDGAERLAFTVGRRMEQFTAPEAKVRGWLEGMLAQTDPAIAAQTTAVLRTSSNLNTAIPTGDHMIRRPIARLLHQPFAMLGSTAPELDAELVTHAVLSRVSGHIWDRTRPSADETERLLRFCLASVDDGARR